MYTPKKTFFTARDLEEKNDIASHITFAERLIYKYNWDEEAKGRFVSLLSRIRTKEEDEKLNLSVVGEFSTGKSTFINAIVRMPVLSSSAMQGTTVASTVIEYGDDYKMRLVFKDGHSEEYVFGTVEELSEKLGFYSTDSHVGKNLEKINVFMPSENLKKGIRIIDTPGTNALESWHEDVTVKTIKEFSDLSIVLVDATKPLPESLCLFVEDNLSDVLDGCIFVVTKIDLVREKERERVIEYVKVKLMQTFDIENPIVLPYVSTAFEEGATDGMKDVCLSSESRMMKHLASRRIMNQSNSMTELIDDMYTYISEQINEILKSYEKELEDILDSKSETLANFVEKQKKDRVSAFDITAKKHRAEFLSELYKISFYNQNMIVETIENMPTNDSLMDYIGTRLAPDCIRAANTILQNADNVYYKSAEWFRGEMQIFEDEFEKTFDNLKVLGVVVPEKSYSLPRAQISEENASITNRARNIALELEKEQYTKTGRFFGTFANIHRDTHSMLQLAQLKNNAKMKLGDSLGEYLGDMVQKAIIAFDNYICSMRECIKNEIDRYVILYQGEVNKKIDNEQGRQLLVETRVENIRMDISDLKRRKTALKALEEEIDIKLKEV